MGSFLFSQFRHRAGRVLAVFLGIAVAAGSFTVLSGAVRTSQAQVTGEVGGNFRSAYDVLVRPSRSQTPLERSRSLVRDNYLSGIFGGITAADYHRIAKIPGVEVAAPIAMLGYVLQDVRVPVDLTAKLDGNRSLFTYQVARTTDRGLTGYPHDQSGYVYATGRRLAPITSFESTDKVFGPKESMPGGRKVTVCPDPVSSPPASGPFDPSLRSGHACWSRRSGLAGQGFKKVPRGHVAALVDWPFPFLVAAIDPAAEAKLAGLRGAMVKGRYLKPTDAATRSGDSLKVPVLVAARSFQDDTDQVVVRRLPATDAEAMTRGLTPQQVDRLVGSGRGPVVSRRTLGTSQAYRQLLDSLSSGGASYVDSYWTTSPTHYRQTQDDGDLTLQPEPVHNPDSVWASTFQATGYAVTPIDNQGTAFRRLRAHIGSNTGQSLRLPQLHAVGRFDPDELAGFSQLSRVPLQTYNPPTATPATSRDKRLLKNKRLLPNGNIAGYLQSPPLMLTTLRAASAFTDPSVFRETTHAAPISVIRIRVAGVTGPDQTSLARIKQVAAAVHDRTGLQVDITAGSSPTPVTVDLAGNDHGRPPLKLAEGWVQKGVAVKILSAVDRKSLVLFALVFVVCALFVANAAAASVRVRRTELGVLACIGWDPRRLFTGVLGELAVIGCAGGIVGAATGWGLAGLTGAEPSPLLTGLVVPAAVLLSLLAGLPPALRAARSSPADAVRPAVRDPNQKPGHAPGRARTPHGITRLATANLTRTPPRTIAAAAALAVGVAALTLVLTVAEIFRGAVVGSLLGNAIAVQVQGADYVAVAVIVILGAAAVADVLYLGIRERAAELATLAATGWRETTLSRLVTIEGVLLGITGSLVGAAAGVVLATLLGATTYDIAPVAGAALVTGTIAAVIATLVPAALVRRLPTVILLAEE